MKIFKTVEDKLESIGWHFDADNLTFITLHKPNAFKLSTTYVGLYQSGEIECYTYMGSDKIKETILTVADYKLFLKLMKKRGWPRVE
jgi:hypothetical protein